MTQFPYKTMADIIRYYYTVQKPASLREAAAAARRAAEQPVRVRSRPPRRPRAPDTTDNGNAEDATPASSTALQVKTDNGGWFRDAIAVAVGRKNRAAASASTQGAPAELVISDEFASIMNIITYFEFKTFSLVNFCELIILF